MRMPDWCDLPDCTPVLYISWFQSHVTAASALTTPIASETTSPGMTLTVNPPTRPAQARISIRCIHACSTEVVTDDVRPAAGVGPRQPEPEGHSPRAVAANRTFVLTVDRTRHDRHRGCEINAFHRDGDGYDGGAWRGRRPEQAMQPCPAPAAQTRATRARTATVVR